MIWSVFEWLDLAYGPGWYLYSQAHSASDAFCLMSDLRAMTGHKVKVEKARITTGYAAHG